MGVARPRAWLVSAAGAAWRNRPRSPWRVAFAWRFCPCQGLPRNCGYMEAAFTRATWARRSGRSSLAARAMAGRA
eukprot:4876818-Lingulodinium_polyedra.AAC.1